MSETNTNNTTHLALTGLTTGNITGTGTDGIIIVGGTSSVIGSGVSISQQVADATHNGYLSSIDWIAFSGKQDIVSIGAIDLQPHNANALTFSGGILSQQSANT